MPRPRFLVRSTTGQTRTFQTATEVRAFLWGKSSRRWAVYTLVARLPREGGRLVARLEAKD